MRCATMSQLNLNMQNIVPIPCDAIRAGAVADAARVRTDGVRPSPSMPRDRDRRSSAVDAVDGGWMGMGVEWGGMEIAVGMG